MAKDKWQTLSGKGLKDPGQVTGEGRIEAFVTLPGSGGICKREKHQEWRDPRDDTYLKHSGRYRNIFFSATASSLLTLDSHIS